jgi:hypothetical protein
MSNVVVVAVPRTSEWMSDAIVREERSMEMPPEADEGVRITERGWLKQPKSPGSGERGRYSVLNSAVNATPVPTFSYVRTSGAA